MSDDELARVKRIGMLAPNVDQVLAWRSENLRLRAQNAELLKKLRIADLKNTDSLANNLCPDHRDKQTGKPCLACTIETRERQNADLLAALRDMVGSHGLVQRAICVAGEKDPSVAMREARALIARIEAAP